MKKLILVIISAIIIGILMTILWNKVSPSTLRSTLPTSQNLQKSSIPTDPTPTPLPPINEASDLSKELESLTPNEFSEDYKKLESDLIL